MDVSLSKDQLLKATLTEDGGGTNAKRDADEPAAMLEPGTLQWLEDRETGTGERTVGVSARSDASSWTESERGRRMERAELIGEGRDHLEENRLPEKAAQVFSPAVTVLPSLAASRDTEAFWEMESERSPFLSPCQVDYNQHGYQFDFPEDTPPSTCKGGCSDRDALKLGVSVMTSALLFPFLVWGGYVFLPFDAPLLVGAPLRLVYTLRCSVFAAAPVVLGWLVLGVSRLRSGSTQPVVDDVIKEAELQEVSVHRRFISDSTSLFLIYFLQLVVMAMYLTQEQLKLVPLLTIVFAFGRLAYWLAAAFGSSLRGFGFGLSFLPSLVMMAANFYFIFTVESAGSVFGAVPPQDEALTPPTGRQRFWG
ncbi:transmembrane protein 79 [Gambusia affinis]|uniref:transmembrane protein 79 n=1 Tax=Gambusia affinis TaxID=33528 RepID=UPI000F39C37E|nr:transmembrane protein 79 [Gambusia affinis]XP_043972625.1 transmembrane protein 79 [Gambusia affinis]XP_043972627.1 transmembrane protein 79 [Gambusia affinis]XP_043972628.1 transmembrane protein 79 [Gambusia affinis]